MRLSYISIMMLGVIYFTSPCRLSAQVQISWSTLAGVTYDYSYDELRNAFASNPSFGEEVRGLEGKEVILKGHVLPIDLQGEQLVLSEYPFSSCFFCGGAGQESVVQLLTRKKKNRYKMDEVRTFKGILRISEDPYGLTYILEEAELVD